MKRLGRGKAAALAAGLVAAALAPAESVAQEITGSVTSYGWIPWIETDATSRATGDRATSTADPLDLIDVLDFAFTVAGEAHYGRFGFLADFQYYNLGSGGTLTGPAATQIDVDTEMLFLTGALGYKAIVTETGFIEPFAGVRYIDLENKVSATGGGPLAAARQVSVGEDWFDPIVGVRAGTRLSDRMGLGGYALIGGFGAGSEFTWEVFAGLDYAITPRFTAVAGFRYLYIDYEAQRAEVKLDQYGPIIGLKVSF